MNEPVHSNTELASTAGKHNYRVDPWGGRFAIHSSCKSCRFELVFKLSFPPLWLPPRFPLFPVFSRQGGRRAPVNGPSEAAPFHPPSYYRRNLPRRLARQGQTDRNSRSAVGEFPLVPAETRRDNARATLASAISPDLPRPRFPLDSPLRGKKESSSLDSRQTFVWKRGEEPRARCWETGTEIPCNAFVVVASFSRECTFQPRSVTVTRRDFSFPVEFRSRITATIWFSIGDRTVDVDPPV